MQMKMIQVGEFLNLTIYGPDVTGRGPSSQTQHVRIVAIDVNELGKTVVTGTPVVPDGYDLARAERDR